MKVNKKLFIKIIIFFVLLIIFFVLLFLSWKTVKTNNKAVKYFNKGNFKLAAQAFDNELKNNPRSNYIVVNNSAGADYKLNKLDESEEKYVVVINSTDSTKEDKFTALYNAGNVEFKKNNFEKAIGFYKEALRINPNDKDTKYNLEVALLKLNEKNNQQENKDNKQDNKKKDNQKSDKQKQQEQDLKKQIEENDKAQKENEKRQQEENAKNDENKNANSEKDNDKKQQELEKEKKELDKQRKEISDKIKDLLNAKKDKEQSKQKQETAQKEQKIQDNKQQDKSESEKQNQMKKDDTKDIQSTIFLNYYNEADKNSNKLKAKNKEPLISQPQEDW
ncbi:MAG: tetratricopeptide repeat protein [Endomicrobium sp.]|jgi:DNA polymerase III gamma/tau subunit|nr:tetratricopeptide repeat protein [Endomicrobium sp.]